MDQVTQKSNIAPAPAPVLAVDQIWRENETRFDRYVLIVATDRKPGKATISTCDVKGVPLYGNTITHAKQERFNNRSSGYQFVGMRQT